MANVLYTSYKSVLEGAGTYTVPDWDGDTIKAVLCTASYTASPTTDTYLSDVSAGARAATATLSSVSISAGAVLCSATVTFSSVPAGPAVTQLVLYKDSGNAATSPLLLYFDSFAAGMPQTPTGANIVLTFNAAGIFTL